MTLTLDKTIADRIAADRGLWQDFNDICDCGGRLAGTESEKKAFALLRERVRAASPANAGRSIPVPYGGWRAKRATLSLGDGTAAACHPLVRTIATPKQGLTAEVVDLGRGTPEEFQAHAADIKGRIVLVRHELMFAAGTIHRRRKYDMARANGAAGFLIAGPLPGELVAGSSGREGGEGIPALGIAPETAARLARSADGWPRATMVIETEESPAETETLVYDFPGSTGDWVVLSAHVDGHDLAESAMDNGTGLAAVLAATRALAPEVARWRRGLRVMFFSVEEWALTGSAQYVKALSQAERDRITLNVNLDSVAGSPNLTALTSGYAGVEPFLLKIAAANGQKLRTVRPLMTNSDHANFAAGGIPAIRLVAGFDDPGANLRLVLTPADTRDTVAEADLRRATILTAAIVAAACEADPAEAVVWRSS
jgi:Zn-dependent M28 family amino/carboxypeptidase